jgi:hypothetical protein
MATAHDERSSDGDLGIASGLVAIKMETRLVAYRRLREGSLAAELGHFSFTHDAWAFFYWVYLLRDGWVVVRDEGEEGRRSLGMFVVLFALQACLAGSAALLLCVRVVVVARWAGECSDLGDGAGERGPCATPKRSGRSHVSVTLLINVLHYSSYIYLL